jgi:hypothetical protein
MLVASTNSISPPAGVQASPVATPGTLVRIAVSGSYRFGPNILWRSATAMTTRVEVRQELLQKREIARRVVSEAWMTIKQELRETREQFRLLSTSASSTSSSCSSRR